MSLLEVARSARPDQSSAEALAQFFKDQGTGRDEITGSHLLPLYSELHAIRQAPRELCLQPPSMQLSGLRNSEAVCAVIVETREHPALEFVVSTFSEQLRIPIQLFHGTENEAFIRSSRLTALLDQGRLSLERMDIAALPPKRYSALLLSREFWNSLAGRNKILVFQTDALLCPASPFTLTDFCDFDYIGSSWSGRRPIGLQLNGGCGGLSLRDWKLSTRSLERFSPVAWPGGEDGFFAFHLDLMGGRVAKADDSARFASQGTFTQKSFGVHKPRLMNQETLERFLDYCPEVGQIL